MIEPLARILLASVFLVAALTKLADLGGSRRSLAAFGLPPMLSGPLGVLLPVTEFAVAIALVPVVSAVAGAIGAMLLLALFVAGIGINLLRGRRPDCHCFGQLYSTPVGWPTVARNLALLAAAAFVVMSSRNVAPVSVLAWAGPLTPLQQAAVVAGFIVLALLGLQSLLLLRVVQQQSRILERLEAAGPAGTAAVRMPAASAPPAGRPVGTAAPDFALPALDGPRVSLAALLAERKPVVLFFSDPNCVPCGALMPEFAELEEKHAHALTVAVITRGTAEANREKTQGRLTRVALQRDREIFEAYGVVGTPTVVLVNPDGTIGSALAQGDAAIRQLLAPLVLPTVDTGPAGQTAAPAAPVPLVPESAAPAFTLTDLDGEALTLDTFGDRQRLVLFWNPSCGYCQRMLPDLKSWEANAGAEHARLLVISTGTVEANRALGLRAPIALDPDGFGIARAYGVQGTPSAALIDAHGRLAAEIAVGAPAILELLGRAPAAAPSVADEPIVDLPDDAKPMKERCVHDELLADGSMVLYNACRNQVMTLNPTAALVWEYCDGDHDVDAIAAELREVFPHARDARHDVLVVLRDLVKSGMATFDVAADAAPDAIQAEPSDVRS
jgi:peroxiredoxin